jgi:3' exoribonuclease, RNase T-like
MLCDGGASPPSRSQENARMKYWLDTEFIEHPFKIDLISIGLVAEDGREFYAESSEVDWTNSAV